MIQGPPPRPSLARRPTDPGPLAKPSTELRALGSVDLLDATCVQVAEAAVDVATAAVEWALAHVVRSDVDGAEARRLVEHVATELRGQLPATSRVAVGNALAVAHHRGTRASPAATLTVAAFATQLWSLGWRGSELDAAQFAAAIGLPLREPAA